MPTLEERLETARRTIASDGYPMSIGELTNMYREGELNIRPEFQRFFRWSPTQKSRLVESLLIGIPLPSIFVAQTETGVWELVDGLQRVSTILELQGELRNAQTGELLPPLVMEATKYLPELEGVVWEDEHGVSLTQAQRLDIKRSKIDVKIIKRESSAETKYDLFQRLNSYGSALTPQELRGALLVGTSPDFYSWIEGLASRPSFVTSTGLSDRLLDERYDLELVLRFLVLHNWPNDKLTQRDLRDFPSVLDDEAMRLALNFSSAGQLPTVFETVFDTVAANGGEDLFRRWDVTRGEFVGSFLNTAFEVIALGLGYHIANGTAFRTDLLEAAREFWTTVPPGFATGKSTEARLSRFVPAGRNLLAD